METVQNKKKFGLKCILALIGMIVLFFALNCVTVLLPLSNYKTHIKSAFETHDLILKAHGGFNTLIGNTQYEDCLILQQGLKLSPIFWQNALNAPKFGDRTKCISLHSVIFGSEKAAKDGVPYYQFIKDLSLKHIKTYSFPNPYYQYLHGARTFAVAMVSVFQLKTVRFIYQNLDYFLVFLIALVVAMSKHLDKHRRMAFAISFFVIFTFFYGINFFGQSLEHGPGDFLDFITFLFIFNHLKKKNFEWYLLTLLISGGWTAYLEKLIGIVPAVTCLIGIAALLYYAAGNRPIKSLIKWVAYGIGFYFAGFIIVYFAFMTLKILITGHMPVGYAPGWPASSFSWSNWAADFGLRVGRNVNSLPVTFPGVLHMLWTRLLWISTDLYYLGQNLLRISFYGMLIVGIWSLISSYIIKGRPIAQYVKKGYLGITSLGLFIYLIDLTWFYIFQNHAFIHPWFMVRIISYPLFAGWFVIACYISDLYSLYKIKRGVNLPNITPEVTHSE